ncbi:MAG: UDP-N-acetylmuramate dehydrogenase [Actinobacteria bacterium]|nr:UDP-N-acetylmuramate dehydrogenase [Actinomycetota bacterium]MBM3712660.1 UDP-N-acetylmuramate dehydrogenase [Actinomycetota bacterium]
MLDKKIIQIKGILRNFSLEGKAVFLENVSKLTSIKAGGKCICFLTIDNRQILVPVLEELFSRNIRFYLLGEGTNILFADGLIDIVLLKLGDDFKYINFGNGYEITLGAAYNLQKFIVRAAKANLDFSFLSGIPGSIGGAVIGNSGTKNESINEHVKRIKYISIADKTVRKKERILTKKDYGYRFFNIPDLAVLTDIFLEGKFLDKNLIIEKIRENIKARRKSQPVRSNNSGCFFKNPEETKLSAGEIIDRCGFKGFRYGGAKVSQVHSNFIENFHNSSAKDIFILAKIIKDYVMDKFMVDLKYEVRLVGF